MTWDHIWYGDDLASKGLRFSMWPLSVLYAAGWTVYRALYDRRILKPAHPYRPTLCIGNLTVGGSGKTPTVLFVLEELRQLGAEVIVSCSGYGSPASGGASWAPEGPLSALEWGDEASLLRDEVPDLALVVGRNRVAAANLVAERNHDRTVLLMDDGFQHLPLAKDASILLDPPTNNPFCLPAGPYREPIGNLHRGDVVVGPSGSFRLKSEITGVRPLSGGDLQDLPSGSASALCAIGRPQQFFQALTERGLQLETRTRSDHDPLTETGLFVGLTSPILVTSKDAVKLRLRTDIEREVIWVVEHRVTIQPLDEFRTWLQGQIASWFDEEHS